MASFKILYEFLNVMSCACTEKLGTTDSKLWVHHFDKSQLLTGYKMRQTRCCSSHGDDAFEMLVDAFLRKDADFRVNVTVIQNS